MNENHPFRPAKKDEADNGDLVDARLSQLLASDIALAQATNQAFAPLQTVVQAVVDFITGPFGRLVAIIAVIGLGFLAFAGRLSWFTAGAVVLGIGLVFGAPAIVDQLMSTVGN